MILVGVFFCLSPQLVRSTAEVMTTIRELGERGIVLHSLREGIDTSNATGRMVAGVLASLAEIELELGRERRTAARDARLARGQSIGRPKALAVRRSIAFWRTLIAPIIQSGAKRAPQVGSYSRSTGEPLRSLGIGM